MTNNMKAMELSDEQLAVVTGGHGGSYNQNNSANVWQSATAETNIVSMPYGDSYINNNTIGGSVAYNDSYIWQKNEKKFGVY